MVELVHGGEVDFQDEAVLPGNAIALHHLGDAIRQLADLAELTGNGTDPNVGGDWQSEGSGVEVEAIAPDDSRFLQAAARLARASFALMLSLLPASALVIGILVLRQIPTLVEVAGVTLVVCGVAVHQERDARPAGADSVPDAVSAGV